MEFRHEPGHDHGGSYTKRNRRSFTHDSIRRKGPIEIVRSADRCRRGDPAQRTIHVADRHRGHHSFVLEVLPMTAPLATNGPSRRYADSKALRRGLGVGSLLVLLLVPVWWWPLVASQDGPSHLYNATVLNESIAGRGPSLAIYKVAWKPVPNWGGSLVAMCLLKLLPLFVVPRVMLSLTAVAPMLGLLWLRRQTGRSQGFLWIVALAGCLATGRAWIMGFEGFSLGTAAALCVIGLYEHDRERLDLAKTIVIAAILTLTYFCHLVPWAFAVFAIAIASLWGPVARLKTPPRMDGSHSAHGRSVPDSLPIRQHFAGRRI